MLAPQVSSQDFAAESFPPLQHHSLPSRYRHRVPTHTDPVVDKLFSVGHRSSVSSLSSLKSNGSASITVFSADSSGRSSFTSNSSFSLERQDGRPTLVQTPWELRREKKLPQSVNPRRQSMPVSLLAKLEYQFPRKYFTNLPKEIYEKIIEHVELSYFDSRDGGCVTCYLQDMTNICLVSRPWLVAATRRMCKRIWLPVDDHWDTKMQKGHLMYRIKVLRRLLRQRPPIARLVRDIRVPGLQDLYDSGTPEAQLEILNQLASLVVECPSLESFSGITIQYDHNFDRLTHALSTRSNLKQQIWSFRSADATFDEYGNPSFARKELVGWDHEYPDAFLNSHAQWTHLNTLVLFGGGVGSMDYRSFAATFRLLPILEKLLISGFDQLEFSDRTLATIPQTLSKLRLENLPGITPKGIDRFSTSQTASRLRSLTLINLNLTTVEVVQKLLELPYLRHFALSQRVAPGIPEESSVTFISPKLEFLHWDIQNIGTINGYLSDSILAGGFPALRQIRCMNDHDGLFQALCKPTGDMLTPADGSIGNLFGDLREGKYVGALTKARYRAQYWIDQARREPSLRIMIHDETGQIKRRFVVGGYVGRTDDNIEFWIQPDVPGSVEPFAVLDDWLSQGVVKESGNIPEKPTQNHSRSVLSLSSPMKTAPPERSFVVRPRGASRESGWCSGPGWGDVQPGMEGKKGHTHARRRLCRLQELDMFF